MTTYINRPYLLLLTAIFYTFLFLKADIFIHQILGKYSLWIAPLILVLFWADMAFNKSYKSKKSHITEVVAILISITLFFCFMIPMLFATMFL